MASEADYDNPDDWELINDDGFVYKRRKRRRLKPPTTALQPAVELRQSHERRKRVLLKLRERYLAEISRWELLSNTLKAMEQSAQTQPMERPELLPTTSCDGASISGQPSASESSRRKLVDDLLFQVEAQETTIRDVSNVCDIADGFCSAEEERMMQQLINLPIWDPSPLELIDALCD